MERKHSPSTAPSDGCCLLTAPCEDFLCLCPAWMAYSLLHLPCSAETASDQCIRTEGFDRICDSKIRCFRGKQILLTVPLPRLPCEVRASPRASLYGAEQVPALSEDAAEPSMRQFGALSSPCWGKGRRNRASGLLTMPLYSLLH